MMWISLGNLVVSISVEAMSIRYSLSLVDIFPLFIFMNLTSGKA